MEYLFAGVPSGISLMSFENIGGNDEMLKYSLDTERAIISTHQNSFSLILSHFRL